MLKKGQRMGRLRLQRRRGHLGLRATHRPDQEGQRRAQAHHRHLHLPRRSHLHGRGQGGNVLHGGAGDVLEQVVLVDDYECVVVIWWK